MALRRLRHRPYLSTLRASARALAFFRRTAVITAGRKMRVAEEAGVYYEQRLRDLIWHRHASSTLNSRNDRVTLTTQPHSADISKRSDSGGDEEVGRGATAVGSDRVKRQLLCSGRHSRGTARRERSSKS